MAIKTPAANEEGEEEDVELVDSQTNFDWSQSDSQTASLYR